MGENLSSKKMQNSYSKEMFTGRAKQIRIIGGPDNQRPIKWNSTVLAASQEVLWSTGIVVTNGSACLSLLSVILQITGCHDWNLPCHYVCPSWNFSLPWKWLRAFSNTHCVVSGGSESRSLLVFTAISVPLIVSLRLCQVSSGNFCDRSNWKYKKNCCLCGGSSLRLWLFLLLTYMKWWCVV